MKTLLWILIAVSLYAAAFLIFFPLTSGQPFAYDESDYMWAGVQGVWANYTDRNGLTIIDFVSRGLDLYRHPEKRAEFSQFIRATGDIGLYRHYHGPMYQYWIAFLSNIGISSEQAFRGSGLLIHFATATLILFGFRAAFPRLPIVAAFVACGIFVFHRTALTAAMTVTPHVMFTFWVVAALFTASMFFRNYEVKWLYAIAAVLAGCFVTLETSIVLLAGLVFAMLLDFRRVRARWPTIRSLMSPLAKAVGVFLVTVVILWPPSLLTGAIAKGYLQLMYMAVSRKTFSPGGPLDLWASFFFASPWEFALLFAGAIAVVVLWRRCEHKAEVLPWLGFTLVFLLVTLKVTLNYTYYFAPLTAACVVLTGVAFGILWNRGLAVRAALSIVIVACMTATAAEWARVSKEIREARPVFYAFRDFLRTQPVAAGKKLHMPYQLVPTAHYYEPELAAVGHDYGYDIGTIVAQLRSPETAPVMLCEQAICDAIQQTAPGTVERRELMHEQGITGRPLYVLHLQTPAANSDSAPSRN